jgi:ubiquinone/menaquinone biosynthesis C-methylase UbiE
MTDPNARFDGTIPAAYDRYLGPLLFEPYASDLAARITPLAPRRVLEVACGTGILTRALRAALPAGTELVATDLNQPMLDHARAGWRDQAAVLWREADACALPFPPQAFDVVVCQFGLMFVPDKPLAIRETCRVLRPGGSYFCSVWDRLERNPLTDVAHRVVSTFLPEDPPQFFQVPFSLHDRSQLEGWLAAEGFRDIRFETVSFGREAPSARDAAIGLLTGTPMANALRDRGIADFGAITAELTRALAEIGGQAQFRTRLQAIVMSAIC